jgi:uncharacterized protein (DUF58 family)
MATIHSHSSSDLFGNGVYCTVEELFYEGQRAKGLDLHRLSKASTVMAGSKRSLMRGRGMEFFESRPYVPFDEMRTIDWKVSARLSKLFTKIFIEERERPIYFVVDLRPSMFFGSRRSMKSVLAAHIAAQLSIAAISGGDQVCGLLFDSSFQDQGGLGHTRQHVARWFANLARATKALAEGVAGPFLDWNNVLLRLANKIRPGALVFLLSDFLDMSDEVEPALFRIRKKAQIFAFAITDPLEEEMPPLGRVGMAFSGERVEFDSSNRALKKTYDSWWRTLQASNEARFQKMGISCLHFKTADVPDTALRRILAGIRTGAL